RDLVHLERVVGRELQPHQELELGPRKVGFGAEALVDARLDDAERLLEVHPGADLVLACPLQLQFHFVHASWNSSTAQPCSIHSCYYNCCKEKVRQMSMTATDFTAPASDAELDELAANLRARNFDVVIVQTGAEAKSEVLRRVPDGV